MKNYYDLEPKYSDPDSSQIVILPIPYEKTTSFIKGTMNGPKEVLNASSYVDLFDEELNFELNEKGIYSDLDFLEHGFDRYSEDQSLKMIEEKAVHYANQNKFLVSIGGEHTITYPIFKPLYKKYPDLSIIQIDAHADLRQDYHDNKWSHACVMKRIFDDMKHPERIFQIGIRSLSKPEYQLIQEHKINTYFSHQVLADTQMKWIDDLVSKLTDHVYLTVDVDGFDPSVMPGTGTPEPLGLQLYPYICLIHAIAKSGKKIVGFDFNEIAPLAHQKNTEFICAKLIYKTLSIIFKSR